jgi:hypothetical protein
MALEQRIRESSKRTGLPISRHRKAVVFESLLARLNRGGKGRWVLKGAVALEFRTGGRARATKDLDLGHDRTEAEALATLQTAARRDIGDFFIFTVEKTSEVADEAPGAVRFLVRAELAGRVFEEIPVDVAFGDPLVGDPDVVKGPGSLEFAGIKAPDIPTLPLEQHVAEKVHAYTRTYGKGKSSTRSKDLVDLVSIGSLARFHGDRLQKAIKEIFASRATHALPSALPEPPSVWRTPYRRMAGEVGLDGDLMAGHRLAARLVDPVLKGSVKDARWDPTTYSWKH